jgi:hypothetical protein
MVVVVAVAVVMMMMMMTGGERGTGERTVRLPIRGWCEGVVYWISEREREGDRQVGVLECVSAQHWNIAGTPHHFTTQHPNPVKLW